MAFESADGITISKFGMGSPNSATIMDLLSAIEPKAVLFLGKCGCLKKKNELGDLILPIAAIRGEGTSTDYFPAEVPALPSFALQKAISTTIRDAGFDYWTGTVSYTHLDVYKRQVPGSNKKLLRGINFPVFINVSGTMGIPVSNESLNAPS